MYSLGEGLSGASSHPSLSGLRREEPSIKVKPARTGHSYSYAVIGGVAGEGGRHQDTESSHEQARHELPGHGRVQGRR